MSTKRAEKDRPLAGAVAPSGVRRPPWLFICDCDGVLVNSEPIAARCFAAAISALGAPVTPEEIDARYRGMRLDACFEDLEARLGRPLPAHFAADLARNEHRALSQELEPIAGIADALERVRAEGTFNLAVASSSAPERIDLALEVTGLAEFFSDRIFSAVEVPRGKPAPDVFLHAARSMGYAPDACVVIEDSAAGIAAARAAGMFTLAYGPGASAGPASRIADTSSSAAECQHTRPGASPQAAGDPGRCNIDRMDLVPSLLVAWRDAGPAAAVRLAAERHRGISS